MNPLSTATRATPPSTPARAPWLRLAAVPLVLLLAAGCDRPDDGRTVGQRVDETVAATERQAGRAADATRETAQEAGQTAREAARDAGQAVREATADVGDKARDMAITAEIKTRLARDEQLRALAIDVDTVSGQVVMRGAAPNTEARNRATELARGVQGVGEVRNELSVQPRS